MLVRPSYRGGMTPDGSDSWASSPAVRAVMKANRRRDTEPELAVRRALHAEGLRYRVDYPLPFDRRRRADIVFPRIRLAVFIDGCFWHGCPQHYRPATRDLSGFWQAKLAENVARDRDTDERLAAAGWTTLRFWEHENPDSVVDAIRNAVTEARPKLSGKAPRP